jgi:hypothetical protein
MRIPSCKAFHEAIGSGGGGDFYVKVILMAFEDNDDTMEL